MLARMSDFLNSCPFLDDADRVVLLKHGVDDADAVLGLGADKLTLHVGLLAGKAGKLVRAAERFGAAAPAAQTTVVHIAPQQSREERTGPALEAASKDPSRVKALLDLGVEHVVLAADDRVDPAASGQLLAHLAAGGRLPATWRGQKIADVRRLSTPPIWCSPRPPHRELQAGADEVSRVMWAALGVDGLRVACHGFARGFFDGMTDDAVLAVMQVERNPTRVGQAAQAGVTRKIVEDDFANSRVSTTAYDHLLFPQPTAPRERDDERDGPPLPQPGSNIVKSLTAFFTVSFSPDELRRELGYLPEGRRIVNNLPGSGVAASELYFRAAEVLHRYGMVTTVLRDTLIALRPRRINEIEAMFSAAGIR